MRILTKYTLQILMILAAVMLVSALLHSPASTKAPPEIVSPVCASGPADLLATPAEAGQCPQTCPHTTCDSNGNCADTAACTKCKMASGGTHCIIGADIPCGECPQTCPHTTCDSNGNCADTAACTRCKMAPGGTHCIIGADIPC